MKLAPYSVFGKLRLRKWYPDDKFLEDQSNWYHVITEHARGVSFQRSTKFRANTYKMEFALDLIEDRCLEILEIIQLPLKRGQSPAEVKSVLGEPLSSKKSRRDHSSSAEFKTAEPEPYSISCFFSDETGLKSIVVRRGRTVRGLLALLARCAVRPLLVAKKQDAATLSSNLE